ncbi:hypothetical protein DPMN_095626 [Dreissena polymorpha]|uniref:Secreted protein n=1 Tax=Dreissena polymorpha TaxID=45954 RepID=A0A9D4L787_DREPO|nr:hypothetical protein DPMN_095626 [Dreissena polymorpha]
MNGFKNVLLCKSVLRFAFVISSSDSAVFSSGWKCLNLTFEDGSTSTSSVEANFYRSIITDKGVNKNIRKVYNLTWKASEIVNR